MEDKLLHVLVIEDSEDDYKLLLRALSKESLLVDAERVDTSEALHQALKSKEWDVIISDNNVPDKRINAKNSLELSRSINPNIPFIIVSGTIGEENAVKLMKLGVNDYILKNSLTRLGPALKREIQDASTRIKKLEAEKKLTESEERYRMLAESIKDMFFAMNKELICTFWNSAAEKMTKINASDAVGNHLFKLLPQAANSPIKEKIFESINTMEYGSIEIEIPFTNHVRHYQVTIYPSPEMHSVMIKDVTEEKNTSRKLKLVNEELETFIYRVSHDVRGPLATMQGLVYIAQNEEFPEFAEELFGRMGKSANRLEEVIKSLQDIVKIKQEDVELKSTALAEIIGEMEKSEEAKLCELNYDTDADEQEIMTDSRLLVIALNKMIHNANVFRHPLRKPKLALQFSQKDQYNQITLTDNGLGIPEDQLDKIFKMFYRGSEQSNGPGLGLYLASSAIEKLGGSIYVSSTVDEGSTFTIRLPHLQ